MATGQYVGVNGVARKVTSPYIGVNGVARNVTAGYVGVDGVARLFFAPDGGGAVVLEVEKVTSDTYANSTTYTAEEFILLDIYPKTGGTVNVTYGGLTKTITDTSGAEEPNAQKVFFGTFNGVTDSVATPSSGELTIDGDYYAFGQATWSTSNKSVAIYAPQPCVKKIKGLGIVTMIPDYAFSGCTGLTSVKIPDTVQTIRYASFVWCTSLQDVTIGKGIVSIGAGAFNNFEENALSTVKMLATTPPELGGETMDGVKHYNSFGDRDSEFFKLREIIVPKGCSNAYKNATGWTIYADLIVEGM